MTDISYACNCSNQSNWLLHSHCNIPIDFHQYICLSHIVHHSISSSTFWLHLHFFSLSPFFTNIRLRRQSSVGWMFQLWNVIKHVHCIHIFRQEQRPDSKHLGLNSFRFLLCSIYMLSICSFIHKRSVNIPQFECAAFWCEKNVSNVLFASENIWHSCVTH